MILAQTWPKRGSALHQEASLLLLTAGGPSAVHCIEVLELLPALLEAASIPAVRLLLVEHTPDRAASAGSSVHHDPATLVLAAPCQGGDAHCPDRAAQSCPAPRSGHSLGPSEARRGPADASSPLQTLARSLDSPPDPGSQVPVQ